MLDILILNDRRGAASSRAAKANVHYLLHDKAARRAIYWITIKNGN